MVAVAQGPCHWCAEPARQSGSSLSALLRASHFRDYSLLERLCHTALRNWVTFGCQEETSSHKSWQIYWKQQVTGISHWSSRVIAMIVRKLVKKFVKKCLWLTLLLSGLWIELLPHAFLLSSIQISIPHKFHLNQTIASVVFEIFYLNYILKVNQWHFVYNFHPTKENGGHNCKSDLESMAGQTCSFNLPSESNTTKA